MPNAEQRIAIALLSSTVATQSSIFPKAVATALEALGMADSQAANLLGVSRPTIGRWKSGKNMPFRLARQPVLDKLRKTLEAL